MYFDIRDTIRQRTPCEARRFQKAKAIARGLYPVHAAKDYEWPRKEDEVAQTVLQIATRDDQLDKILHACWRKKGRAEASARINPKDFEAQIPELMDGASLREQLKILEMQATISAT